MSVVHTHTATATATATEGCTIIDTPQILTITVHLVHRKININQNCNLTYQSIYNFTDILAQYRDGEGVVLLYHIHESSMDPLFFVVDNFEVGNQQQWIIYLFCGIYIYEKL